MSSIHNPLVFIHGIKGSALSPRNGSQLWLTSWQALGLTSQDLRLPTIWDSDVQRQDDLVATSPLRTVAGQDVYAGFLKWAEQLPRPFYSFAYDWRRDNLETVEKFLTFMGDISARHGRQKVQVVAHSMGGLVSFVALNRRPDLFHSVLFAGVPFAGGISFLEDLHSGTPTGFNKRILSPDVLFTFVSPYCFFPSASYNSKLVQENGDPIQHDWYSIDSWEQHQLGIFAKFAPTEITADMRLHLRNALTQAGKFRSLLVCRSDQSFTYPPIAVLASDAQVTISTVVRNGPRAVRGWDFKTGLKEPGDGRVLFSAATPPEGVPHSSYKTRYEHGALLKDVSEVSQILAYLDSRSL
jgi:pimeloyl-ACP methyl ester carboxylesterase